MQQIPASISRRAVIALGLAAAATGSHAQGGWPNKPIKIVLPYPAGGGAEPILRHLMTAITAKVGQPMLLEFKPGANGAIGANQIAKAPPDGYNFLFVPAPPVVHNKLLYKNLPYDPEKELIPVVKVGESPMLIMVNPKVPAQNIQQLMAYAKANPGGLKVAHVGAGSIAHLSALLVEKQAGVKLTMVPYATAQRLNDLLSGEIDMMIDLPSVYLPHIAAGKLRAIAVMTATRFPSMPTVPTAAEGGFPGMLAEGWYGIYAPRGVPREIVMQVNAAVSDYLSSAAGKEQMLQYALVATPTTPEGHQQYLNSEYQKWGPLVRDANISLE